MATGFSEQRASYVRSVPPLKPSTGVSNRLCTRPSSTCKSRGHPQSRPQEINNKHFSRHSNQELPRNQHLSVHHRTVSNYYSKTFSSLQNSGRNSSRSSAQIPLSNGSVIRQLSENPGVLRLSRRRRGLPPDPSPSPINQVILDNKGATVPSESNSHIDKIPQKDADCDKDFREELASHMDKITGSHDKELRQDGCGHVSEMELERGSCINEDQQGMVNIGKLSALEPSQERVNFTNGITNYDLNPVSEIICRRVREKRFQRNQSAPSTILKPITRTTHSRTFARAATARTTVTKAAINSVTSRLVHTDPPASYSAKHTTKGTNKCTSKDITKCTSPTSSYFIHNSKGAAKDSSKGTAEESTKDSTPVSSYSSTSKGLTQIKPTTSAIKTRTSPRILPKR